MVVDILAAVIVVVLVWMGWRSGALRQVLRVLALVLVFVGVPFVAPLMKELVFGESGVASPGVEVGSIFLAALLIYGTLAISAYLVIRIMRAVSLTLSLVDRTGGAALGALLATLLVYLLAALVAFLQGPLSERDPDDRLRLRSGRVIQAASAHNLMGPWQFPDLVELHRALRVGKWAEERGGYDEVRRHPQGADFLRREAVKALLEDEELMTWVIADSYPMTLAQAQIRELLNDRKAMEELRMTDWESLENEAAAQVLP